MAAGSVSSLVQSFSRVVLLSLAVLPYGFLVYLIEAQIDVPQIPWSEVTQGALAVALGILVALRVNRAYERWWEARTLWGSLVNVSRNLAVKVARLVDAGAADRERVRILITGFAHSLRGHLQQGISLREIPGMDGREDPSHVPAHLVGQIYATFRCWKELPPEQLWVLDSEARRFLEVCGGCERIRDAPIPPVFRRLVHVLLVVFLLALPWATVNDFGLVSVPFLAFAAFVTLSAEGITDIIEHPFDERAGLRMADIAAAIEVSVTEILSPAADGPGNRVGST